MGGDVNSRHAPILAIALLLSGCGLLPGTDTEQSTVVESNHTLQELCDFAKKFFSTRYDAPELVVSIDATRPMSAKIGGGNGCSYQTPGRKEYLGNVSLFRVHEAATAPTSENRPSRILRVDDVAVAEIVQPIPEYLDPATARPYYELTATIGKWEGRLEFKNGDEQGTQAGARVLIDMIRALKS
ncbi:hypothetical protein [Nocardia sp. NPDC057455]|uniref:hypothetical protein n=1 Tax=Nocardia sp. NPDC057455 TaxID=3346138 RepID=UPI0036731EDF